MSDELTMMTHASPGTDPSEGEATLLDLFVVLARRWRTIASVAAGSLTLAVLAGLLLPRKYTSTTTFIPEVSSSLQLPSGLAGIAGELGVGLGGDATVSPRFFANVLKSRALMERTLLTRFPTPNGSPADSAALLQLLDIGGEDRLDSLQRARDVLDDMIATNVDAETSIITVKVTTEDRTLSADVANALMTYLDDFNTRQRQTNARAQRRFVEDRLTQSGEELHAAELHLKGFYEANRTWQQSPQLTFQEGQLRRRVEVLEEVYLTLNREYEKTRIDELNDTPGITVIDTAVPTVEQSSPKLLLLILMFSVLGVAGGAALALGLEFVVRLRRADPAGYAALRDRLPGILQTRLPE